MWDLIELTMREDGEMLLLNPVSIECVQRAYGKDDEIIGADILISSMTEMTYEVTEMPFEVLEKIRNSNILRDRIMHANGEHRQRQVVKLQKIELGNFAVRGTLNLEIVEFNMKATVETKHNLTLSFLDIVHR